MEYVKVIYQQPVNRDCTDVYVVRYRSGRSAERAFVVDGELHWAPMEPYAIAENPTFRIPGIEDPDGVLVRALKSEANPTAFRDESRATQS
jgi:hypothetical protein